MPIDLTEVMVRYNIESLIRGHLESHNGPDLLYRWLERGCDYETQVLMDTSLGQQVEDKPTVWTDGEYEFWNIRIPKNANSDPYFHDYPLRFPLCKFATDIGTNGLVLD